MSRTNSTTKIIGALTLLLAIYVSFSSPGKVVITETGDITGITNIARKLVQGKSFWRQQLVAVTAELDKLYGEPAETAKLNQEMNSMLDDAQREMEKMYQEYPETRPSEAERQAEVLRNKADSIEQAELDRTMDMYRLERIASLRKIYSLVEERAR